MIVGSNRLNRIFLQQEQEVASEESHRRNSERGLLEADLEDQDEAGLEDGLTTPPLQHSPSWSLSRSRINSYRVIHLLLALINYTSQIFFKLFPL